MENQITYYEVSFECRNLINTDFDSKTDSYINCKIKNVETQYESDLGCTEVVWDSLNPSYTKKFKVESSFIEILEFNIDVYDTEENEVRNGVPEINKQRLIGSVNIDLISVSKSFGKKVKLDIMKEGKKNPQGQLLVYIEQLNQSNNTYTFSLKASHIKKLNEGILGWLFSDSFRPFINFYKITENNEWIKTFEAHLKLSDKHWYKHDIEVAEVILNNQDKYRTIKAELVHRKRNDEEQIQDQFEFNVAEIVGSEKKRYYFTKNQQSYLEFSQFKIKTKYQFTDFLRYGLNLNLLIGVDYTASNLKPTDPNSLHNINSINGMNEYQKSLWAVGNILINYDSDQTVPLYGFGCRVHNTPTNHAYPIHTHYGFNDGFIGMNAIMQAYDSFTRDMCLVLSGPTNFTPILKEVVSQIDPDDITNYYVLLMLTDGQITDFVSTVDFLVKCSNLPISIVIVAVGKADFTQMHRLDNDDNSLKDTNGKRMVRDCVQFVEYRSCSNDLDKLRREVLMELPTQIEEYYEMKGLSPENIFKKQKGYNQLMAQSIVIPNSN